MSHMLWLGEKVLAGEKDLTARPILEKIEAVSADDIMRVSKGLFKDNNLNLAIIGPSEDEKQIKGALHF